MKITRARLAALFFLISFLSCAQPLYAAELVNINTADSATLQTLSGIGPSKAQAIIDYRTQHGAFAAIEDIMNVSGIGTVTFNNIKDFITVGAATPPPAQPQATSTEPQLQAQPQQSIAGNGPPPITVHIDADTLVTAGGGSFFEAAAYGTQALPLPGTRFIWNFGDGETAEGARVFHAYHYPGRYAVVVTAGYNYSSAMQQLQVEAIPAQVSLRAEGDGSLLISNLSKNDLDIGLWSLVDGAGRYVIPEDTIILPGEGVRFSPVVTQLPGSTLSTLRYPNDALAASATPGPDSPLRGERVPAAALNAAQRPPAAPAPAPQQDASDTPAAVSLAPAAGPASSMLWTSLAALAGVLAMGVAGVRYARPKIKEQGTSPSADEFEIE